MTDPKKFNRSSNAAKKAWKTRRAKAAAAKRAASSVKAAATRRARKEYADTYGQLSYNVMKFVSQEKDSHAAMAISQDSGSNFINVGATLGAYKANLKRSGAMRELALACNFGL